MAAVPCGEPASAPCASQLGIVGLVALRCGKLNVDGTSCRRPVAEPEGPCGVFHRPGGPEALAPAPSPAASSTTPALALTQVNDLLCRDEPVADFLVAPDGSQLAPGPEHISLRQALGDERVEPEIGQGERLPVFVYGTLREGHGNSRLLDGADFERGAWLPQASMYARGIPYVTWSEDPTDSVVGELVHVPESMWAEKLRRLDALEGYQGPGAFSHYQRVRVTVIDALYVPVQVWMYAVNPEQAVGLGRNRVPGGDFTTVSPW